MKKTLKKTKTRKPGAGERRKRNLRAAVLIERWMRDQSGYDEDVWPALESVLKPDPVRFREDT